MTFLRRCLLALLILAAAPAAAAGDADWLYRGSDIPRDEAWTFGTLPNGLRYAVRRNALPDEQVSIRLRIDAGSLNERDEERGWAHFVEHMAFRGTENFGDGEARQIWQKLGANFGSDTNASTSPTQTVYQLDLPGADRSEIDLSLDVISDMADSALFDPALVEAERRVILAEKRRRPELTTRMMEASWPLFYAGLKVAERDPIGTDATLRDATAEGLRAFYERWYRPERATLIMVGDADPQAMEAMIATHFGDWRGTGPAPQEPDYGVVADTDRTAATLAYPGAPHSATLLWLRPYEALPNTMAREKADLARSLASRIVNRRLDSKARGQAAFINASLGEARPTHIADMTQLSITVRDGRWRDALGEAFAILNDALRAPPSAAEIAREIENLRTAATSAVEGASTIRSQQWAQQMINAIDGNSIVASPATALSVLDALAPQMTPELIGAATRDLFEGAGPRIMLAGPESVPVPAVEAALAVAGDIAPSDRVEGRLVDMDDLPPLGAPGEEVSRQAIEDMGVTIVRFANGSTLTFKQTDFEKGSVSVQLRFGEGQAGLPADEPSLAWLDGIVSASGVGDLDLDAMERLLTGRKMAMSFGMAEDALVLRGQTNGTDLADQLRLLATKLAFPRWDTSLFARFKASALESYELNFASAAARAGREFPAFSRSGDERWAPTDRDAIAEATPEAFEAFFAPLLAAGPVHAIVVGDVDLETAVAAMAKSVAALPTRTPVRETEASLAVRPPSPDPEARTFTHNGDPDQAYAVVGWTTFGGTDRIKERRALSLAANMLQVRLYERLREAEGATYSPTAISSTSQVFPDWGIFYAAAEIPPESADTFFRIAREVVADLAAKPASPDEFARAQNPVISGIERRLRTNGYWLNAMEGWIGKPELIDQTRSFLSDYATMTAEDVQAAVAKHVTDAGDWSMLVLPGKANGGGH
ncbi:M16 family metallopeptidase [Enterovirga sp. GCM10030262]|uniref:M16 family metallopeptidase n=1 Tax=Enterovirga sp. GCM10030262 TaxID=3273391 RepID=UPI0036220824